MKLLFISLAVATMSLRAHADALDYAMHYDNVERFYQVQDFKFLVSLTPAVSRITSVKHVTFVTADQTFGLSLEYGFSKHFSIAITDTFGTSAKVQDGLATVTRNGSSNPDFLIRLSHDLDHGDKLFTYLDVAVSLAHQEPDKRGRGGNVYTPTLAYQHRIDETSLEAFGVDTTYYAPSTSDVGNISTTSTDHFLSSIFAIYEIKSSNTKYGGGIDLQSSYGFTGNGSSSYIIGGSLYAVLDLSKTLTLTPQVGYSSNLDGMTKQNASQQNDVLTGFVRLKHMF